MMECMIALHNFIIHMNKKRRIRDPILAESTAADIQGQASEGTLNPVPTIGATTSSDRHAPFFNQLVGRVLRNDIMHHLWQNRHINNAREMSIETKE